GVAALVDRRIRGASRAGRCWCAWAWRARTFVGLASSRWAAIVWDDPFGCSPETERTRMNARQGPHSRSRMCTHLRYVAIRRLTYLEAASVRPEYDKVENPTGRWRSSPVLSFSNSLPTYE